MHMIPRATWTLVLCFLAGVNAGQPLQSDYIGQFKIVGDSLVSAQQESRASSCFLFFIVQTIIIRHFLVPPTRSTLSTKPKTTLSRSMGIPHGRLVIIHNYILRGDHLSDNVCRVVGEWAAGTANGHCHQFFLRSA